MGLSSFGQENSSGVLKKQKKRTLAFKRMRGIFQLPAVIILMKN